MFVVAIRDIEVGEPLKLDHREQYWRFQPKLDHLEHDLSISIKGTITAVSSLQDILASVSSASLFKVSSSPREARAGRRFSIALQFDESQPNSKNARGVAVEMAQDGADESELNRARHQKRRRSDVDRDQTFQISSHFIHVTGGSG